MSDLSKEVGVDHAEDKSYPAGQASYGKKSSFGTRVKQHYRRFWWLHLIILAAVVLVITLPLVYVGVPHIAQSDVNKSRLNITSMSILDPTPDSFDLELVSVLTTHSKFHPQLDSFNASLYLEDSDTPFIQLEIPPIHAENGAESHIKQKVQITNMKQYTEYAKTVLAADDYYLMMRGRGGLKEGSLPKTNVNYNNNITMKGFNGLKGFNVTEFQILTTTLPDGSNMNGTATIPNPTVMTLALGNVTLALSVSGTPIGVSTLPNLLLRPGSNSVPLRAVTNQSAVIGILLQPKYKSGILPVDIVGNMSTYNGQDLRYYDSALQSNKLSVELNVGQALQEAGLGSLLGGIGNSTA